MVFPFFLAIQTNAQDFYHDYSLHLLQNHKNITDSIKKRIHIDMNRLRQTLNKFESENGLNILEESKIYIIDYYWPETGESMKVIYDGIQGCKYRLKYSKRRKYILDIKTDASDVINNLSLNVKKTIITADTANYSIYARKHLVLDGPFISFTTCALKDGNWDFTSSKSYEVYVDKEM